MEDKLQYQKGLTNKLIIASKAYYANDEEIMSNFEYDRLYDELVKLEEESGVILAGSPTQNVGYEAVESLPKEQHAAPMLSLSKTKDRDELKAWLGGHEGLLSWKLDGLTVVLTYEGGVLSKAVTRGNGEIGEVITNNAKTFINLPVKIAYEGKLIIRGEAVIGYEDFEKINSEITDPSEQYKNPRNLCSGSVRQLNNEITAKRRVRFMAFALVEAEGVDFANSRMKQMEYLASLGFETVTNKLVTEDNILETIEWYAETIKTYDIPSDGLVLCYDDIAYGKSLGRTAKAPRNAIAFKWQDEVAETTLVEIEWSPSRTGLINPVAIFEPVELEGTTVSRASVHNVSVMKALRLGIGDRITVYKANMIIPQIADNLTKSDSIVVPDVCPVCGGPTKIQSSEGADTLVCVNPECPIKKLKALSLFVSRDALNIQGLSEATIEKFVACGFISDYEDFFGLERYKEDIVRLEGFGEKSYDNIIDSVEASKDTTLPRVLYALGIANIGVATAKLVAKHFKYDVELTVNATVEDLLEIDGVGDVIAKEYVEYWMKEGNKEAFYKLLGHLKLEEIKVDESAQTLAGLGFVVTGSLNHFTSRNELKDIIEGMGGKVAGSVSNKTTALINNDVTSNSSKNKKAKELGVEIISEEDFMQKYGISGTI